MPACIKTTPEQQKAIDRLTDNLKVLRAAAGLSQQDVAACIGISRASYVGYENKRMKMPWNTYLALMCIFLHCENTQDLMNTCGLILPTWPTT